MLRKSLIVALVIAYVAGDLQGEPERFLISPVTKTVTTTVTSFTATPVTSYCASLNGVVGACRRRRDVQEDPIVSFSENGVEQIVPSLPLLITPTAVPVQSINKREAVAPASAQIASSKSEMTVQINDLGSICQAQQQGRFFGLFNPSNIGLTVFYTTTATATVTSPTPGATTIVRFTVSGCTPSPFAFPVCA